jgi:hypothetical protein
MEHIKKVQINAWIYKSNKPPTKCTMRTIIYTINITSFYMFRPRSVIFRENCYLHIKLNITVHIAHLIGGLLLLYELMHGHGAN